jgi:hypothetical protein
MITYLFLGVFLHYSTTYIPFLLYQSKYSYNLYCTYDILYTYPN